MRKKNIYNYKFIGKINGIISIIQNKFTYEK